MRASSNRHGYRAAEFYVRYPFDMPPFPLDPPDDETKTAQVSEFCFAGKHGRAVLEYADLRVNMQVLRTGVWVIACEFDGPWHAWRFAEVTTCTCRSDRVIPVTSADLRTGATDAWWGTSHSRPWDSSLSQTQYELAVGRIQRLIADGTIEQINLCRILETSVSSPGSARGLHEVIARNHPAPYEGWFEISGQKWPGLWLVSATPELGIKVRDGQITSAPIKGTAETAQGLPAKDFAESRLVSQAVCEELGRVCSSVEVVDIQVEEHPGLVQLVSTVQGSLRSDPADDAETWGEILRATTPPASVLGVPRQASSNQIKTLEPVARSLYCGQFGWLDVDAGQCILAAMIRSFWWRDGKLRFGAGAGITAASDPTGEWEETVLKSARLIRLADSYLEQSRAQN